MQKSQNSDLLRYWPFSHYNNHGKVRLDVPYNGESYPARLYEHSHFPYTYAYDVPSPRTYPRSMYGRGFGSQSEYGYRSPYVYPTELFGYKYPPYAPLEETDYYRDITYPRYSRFNRPWYY